MFQKMKRVLSLVLALALMVSAGAILTACGDENVDDTTTADETTAESTTGSTLPDFIVELPKQEGAEYTYNSYLSTFPTLWNPHDYETATDATILDYASAGFYTFDYNETFDGYALVPDMAVGEPVDVTADYVGEEWGIAEGETAKAWKVTIRSDIKWQDGTPITAQSFVNSTQLLLNPVAGNYRADSVYSGSFKIVNAKNYFYGGQTVDEDNGATEAYTLADLVKGEDGVYTTADGKPVYFSATKAIDWCNGNSLQRYVDAYADAYFNMTNWEAVLAAHDADGKMAVTDENIELFCCTKLLN